MEKYIYHIFIVYLIVAVLCLVLINNNISAYASVVILLVTFIVVQYSFYELNTKPKIIPFIFVLFLVLYYKQNKITVISRYQPIKSDISNSPTYYTNRLLNVYDKITAKRRMQ